MVDVYRVPVADADRIRAGLALQLVAAATGISVEKMTAPVRLKGWCRWGRWRCSTPRWRWSNCAMR